MKRRYNKREYMVMAIFAVASLAFLIPFAMVVAISFSHESDIVTEGYKLIPTRVTLDAYRYMFGNPQQLLTGYKITVFVTVVGTCIGVIMMSMCAYCLVRKNFKYRKYVMFYLFFTMLFHGGLVPSYILITQYLQLGDTITILVLQGLVNVFHIVLLRTYFQSVPHVLFEAARIDGANEFIIYLKILMPMSKPAIATVALMGALVRWNDWNTPMLYINEDALTPLSYVLYKTMADLQFMASNMTNLPETFINTAELPAETSRMAMCVLGAGPMLFVFPFFQKYFVSGLTVGAVKE